MKNLLMLGLSIAISSAIVQTTSAESNQPGDLPLVFEDDFEKGRSRWQTTDDAAWSLHDNDNGKAFGLNKKISDYTPKYRSPHNIALIKGIEVADFVLTFEVKSTKDSGVHRDCCIFFNYQDPTHFYYVHLGARPDPVSGQIMIVNNAPRVSMTENEKPVPWDNAWHKVKLVRDTQQGLIEVYFDDMKKAHMSVVDKTFGKGQIGIGSFDDLNDFDNIKLWGK